ncbi:MAG TPA: hypothetical protein VHY08_04020 [Bacillota bacterium]|nr:hypothetical protein [Bacillota bacterium]
MRFEQELLKFQQTIGEIKQDLLHNTDLSWPSDTENYKLATILDLSVSKLIRIMERR